jgi:hypothetical protein
MKRHCILYSAAILVVGNIAPTSFAQSAPSANSSSAPPVLASTDDSQGAGLRCDILQVKRVSGDALLIRWKYDGSNLTNPYDIPAVQPYYIDPVQHRKYSPLMAPTVVGAFPFADRILPERQWGGWAKFPAPPTTTKKITIYLPGVIPAEDVPVSE